MRKNVERHANNAAMIPASDEAWEKRELGCSEAHVKVSDDVTDLEINEALDLHPISSKNPAQSPG